MVNKGVELINKANRQENLIKEISENLMMEKMTRYQLAQRVDKLTNEVEKHDAVLDAMINVINLHNESLKHLIRDVNALHKWLMWQSISVAILAFAWLVLVIRG